MGPIVRATPAGPLAVLGLGYVGLVTAAGLASVGHRVVAYDIDEARRRAVAQARVPFYEPGLAEVVESGIKSGRLTVAPSLEAALADASVVFLAVGTPPRPDGSADLCALVSAVGSAAPALARGAILVNRSTVPPGTARALVASLRTAGRNDAAVVSMPEFLAEGTALRDFREPSRLVFGGEAGPRAAVAALFDPLPDASPRIFTDWETAEIAKYAANSFLAARVSLINEMANLCDAVGADVETLSKIVGSDPRIGPLFLRPGAGYGGSCFPKDVRALEAFARARSIESPVLSAIEATNDGQPAAVLARARALVGGSFTGLRVAILGVAFKPGTDDVRSAPSLRLARALVAEGAQVVAHDPKASLPADLAREVEWATTVLDAIHGADLVLHVTEWPEFRALDWSRATPRRKLVVDARNALDADALTKLGYRVATIGRGVHGPQDEAP